MNKEYSPERKPLKNAELHILRPENPVTPFPVHFAIGFGNDARAYRIAINELCTQGFVVTTADYALGSPALSSQRLKLLQNVDKLKTDSIRDAIEEAGHPGQNGRKQAHIVAHSKGFIDAILYAQKHPEGARSIVGVAPGGLHEKGLNPFPHVRRLKEGNRLDGFDKEVRRFEQPDLEELIQENEIFKNWWENQGLRYAREGLSTAVKTVQDKLEWLRDNGVKIALIFHEGDHMFPKADAQKVLTPGMADEIITTQGIHGEVKYNPVVAQTIAEIIKRFDDIT